MGISSTILKNLLNTSLAESPDERPGSFEEVLQKLQKLKPPKKKKPAKETTPTQEAAWLVVIRGEAQGVEFDLQEGDNLIGRSDDEIVDIDLTDQESEDRIWSSRRHALVTLDKDGIHVEDLGSASRLARARRL